MKTLTLAAAKRLKGQTIITHYTGYAGQDGDDKFTVGKITNQLAIEEYSGPCGKFASRADYWRSYMTPQQLEERKTTLVLLDHNGVSHSIFCHTRYSNHFNQLTFTCSDADRAVSYQIIGKEETPCS